MVLILVNMDRGDQDLYIGTKYSIMGHLLCKIYGAYNNPLGKICYKNTLVIPSIQIMNVYEYTGTTIFIRWKMKWWMVHFIFQNIHYFFYIKLYKDSNS